MTIVQFILGSASVAAITILVGWFAGTPRIKAFLWRNFPTLPKLVHAVPPRDVLEYEERRKVVIPSEWLSPPEVESWHVEAEVVETRWLPEIEEFSRLSARFWDGIRDHFGRYGTDGQPTTPSYLDTRVRAAAWPDEPDEDDGELDDGYTISPYASAALLNDFVRRLYEHDTSRFEESRRELAIIVHRWWSRSRTDRGFGPWLRTTMSSITLATVKLLWYVEVARAASLHNPEPNCGPYTWLRDLMSGPTAQASGAAGEEHV